MNRIGDSTQMHAGASLRGIRAEGNTTEEQNRKAALFVASRARDVEDCRELLMALGLMGQGFEWVQSSRNRRKKVEQ